LLLEDFRERHIDYRVWDTEKKEMYRYDSFGEHTLGYTMTLSGAIYDIYGVYQSQLIMTQWIGLPDCTGETMIYEGDIVEWDSYYIGDSCMPSGKGVVMYMNGSYELFGGESRELCSENISNDSMRVIGDIFRNSELMENIKVSEESYW
jgi:uncharacterized phage protein (TIGR01671 family)